MDTDELLNRVAKILMATYSQTIRWNPGDKDNILEPHSIRVSRESDQRYRLNEIAMRTAETAAKVFVSGLDNYPIKTATDALIDMVIMVHDQQLQIGQVQGRLRVLLGKRFTELSQLAEWEFLTPVAGMYLEGQPVKVGRCQFQRFDQAAFLRWAQRCSTGKYNPPPDAPVYQSALNTMSGLRGNPVLIGQVTAVVRVRAADPDHARNAGEAVVEESLNLWRYGQLAVTGFNRSFSEIRLSPPEDFSHLNLCTPTDDSGFCGVASNSQLGGTVGHPVSVVSLAPGWKQLEAMLHKPRPSRTEIESRLSTALLWCGNAGLSMADPVRLASLVTALEAMLLQKGESRGKKAKLVKRTFGLLGSGIADKTGEIYGTRSDCIHNGESVVEDHVMRAARMLVAECIGKLSGDSRFTNLATLEQILNVIDPMRESATSDD